jgi:hypothetical protein
MLKDAQSDTNSQYVNDEEEEDGDYHAALLEMEREELERKREAMAMLGLSNSVAAPQPKTKGRSVAHDSEDDDNEEEEDEEDEGMLSVNPGEYASDFNAKNDLRVEITKSNYNRTSLHDEQHSEIVPIRPPSANRPRTADRERDRSASARESARELESNYEDDFSVGTMEPFSGTSVRTAKSIRSAMSSKSLRSLKSNRSKRSGTKSPALLQLTGKGLQSPSMDGDDYTADGFESPDPTSPASPVGINSQSPKKRPKNLKPHSPKSLPPSPGSPLNKRHHRELREEAQRQSSGSRSRTLIDASTQHIETREVHVQANLVVSASGLVYELPATSVGAVQPTIFGVLGSTVPIQQQQGQSTSCTACPHCQQPTPVMQQQQQRHQLHNHIHTPRHNDFLSHVWNSLNNPLNPTFASLYAQRLGENVPPFSQTQHQAQQPQTAAAAPPQAPAFPETFGLTNNLSASLLANNNMFARNLELVREHLRAVRLETDRVLSESRSNIQRSASTDGPYSTFASTKDYIERHRPKVRSKEEALQQLAQD